VFDGPAVEDAVAVIEAVGVYDALGVRVDVGVGEDDCVWLAVGSCVGVGVAVELLSGSVGVAVIVFVAGPTIGVEVCVELSVEGISSVGETASAIFGNSVASDPAGKKTS